MHPYLALQAWNRYLFGPATFNLARAQKENVPVDVLYENGKGEWIRLADLDATHPFRSFLIEFMATHGTSIDESKK